MSSGHKRTIIDLPRYIKYAREQSMLGNYSQSLQIYSKIIKIIKQRMENELKDPYIIERWKATSSQLKAEITLVVKANELCDVFQKDEIDEYARIERENEKNNQILMRDYKIAKKRSSNIERDEENRWEHFGGQEPFAYLQNKNYKDDDYSYKNSREFYKNANEYKDPDVWDPPDDCPRFNYKKAQSKPNKNCNNNKGNEPKPQSDMNIRRNYDRPWKVPEVSKPKDSSSSNKDGKGKEPVKDQTKSAFLLDRYPDDGVGPDSDLIDMIEREVVESTPNVRFEDIAELDNAKKALQEAVILPLLMPDFFQGIRRPWKGVLLFGPPGTGKTLLAKALATQGKTTFFNVSATTFASKWRGESEKLVRILFEMARFYAPSTIFIDEVDSIGTKRSDGDNEASRRVMAEMLVQMDGISSTNPTEESGSSTTTSSTTEPKSKIVMVLGATNHPWDLDDALRRRFEKRVYIPLPNNVGREQMFKINLKGIKLASDLNYANLVKQTEGYSGSDIANVCREAAHMPMRRELLKSNGKFDIMSIVNNPDFQNDLEAPVSQDDILTAIKNISKSVGAKDLVKYDEWTKEFSNK